MDAREAAALVTTIAHLRSLPHPFDQSAGPVHVTGSAIVTSPQGVLLHLHRRLGMWLQPGGHLEPGESPWEAAARELAEETGLRLQPALGAGHRPALSHVDVHDGGRGHTHLDLRFHFLARGDEALDPGPCESRTLRWWSWDHAIEVADEGLRSSLRVLRHAAGCG